MPDLVSSQVTYFTGLFGAAVYLIGYGLMQWGVIRGHSYIYGTSVIVAASCVMVSLIHAFNMAALVIQSTFILVSFVGMARLYWQTKLVRFSPEEVGFVTGKIPFLRPHLSRRLLNVGEWMDVAPGTRLTVQGEEVTSLSYLHDGQVRVEIDGHDVGYCGPGTFIGELTFMTGKTATATVISAGATRCLQFRADRVAPLVRRSPEIHMALIASFSGDTRDKLLQRNHESIALKLASVAC